MLSFVVAIAKNKVIGKDKDLAWHLPNDVRYFREITLSASKTMIMGRRTFESLPKVLPGRKHIVLTRDKEFQVDDENVQIIHSINDILSYVKSSDEYFVIGGAQIFAMLFPYTTRMYLTKIHHNFAGDTFFPEYNPAEWKVKDEKRGTVDKRNQYEHTFYVLERV
ncbi:MAG: dihydrofolate reductase [Firmicutes bacterium]|nr:dihydrofolate reductase [Bacillota bacterium]